MLATNQKFGTLVKPSRKRTLLQDEFKYLESRDRQMRFNNSKDPIYYIFDCIENRPLDVLAKEFVKDSVYEVMNFVSRVVNQ